MCEWYTEISDDVFGYWDTSWGDVPVHVEKCSAMPVGTHVYDTPVGPDVVALCAEHLAEIGE